VASNGWYQVKYQNKTGWISNKYVTVVAKRSAPKAPTPKITKTKKVNLWVATKSTVNMRKGAGTSHSVVRSIPKHSAAKATAQAVNGWYKVTYKKKSGWISNKHVITCTKGCQVDTGNYTTNRAGLNDRYFTKSNGADLYSAAGKRLRIGDIPKNSVVYRDVKWEKAGGPVTDWYFVRTQGMDGWMKASALTRKNTAATSNSKGITRKQALKQHNGKLPASMLVAIPWDKEKTLIAAPAVKDLTRLNAAFKKNLARTSTLTWLTGRWIRKSTITTSWDRTLRRNPEPQIMAGVWPSMFLSPTTIRSKASTTNG
jgi:SH3 domain protein